MLLEILGVLLEVLGMLLRVLGMLLEVLESFLRSSKFAKQVRIFYFLEVLGCSW